MTFKIISTNRKNASSISLRSFWFLKEKLIVDCSSTAGIVLGGFIVIMSFSNMALGINFMSIACSLLGFAIVYKSCDSEKYLLSSDIGYVTSQEKFYERERIIKGSPAAKMLMTGLAAKSYQSGHGFLAGLLASGASNVQADDTAYTETTSKTFVTVYTMDGFFYRFSPDEKTTRRLTKNSVFDDLDEWKLYCRMLDDGKRVAEELKEERKGLLELIEEKSHLSDNCKSFKDREVARTELSQAKKLLNKMNSSIDGIEKYASSQNV